MTGPKYGRRQSGTVAILYASSMGCLRLSGACCDILATGPEDYAGRTIEGLESSRLFQLIVGC
jgi:hypothetical protein